MKIIITLLFVLSTSSIASNKVECKHIELDLETQNVSNSKFVKTLKDNKCFKLNKRQLCAFLDMRLEVDKNINMIEKYSILEKANCL